MGYNRQYKNSLSGYIFYRPVKFLFDFNGITLSFGDGEGVPVQPFAVPVVPGYRANCFGPSASNCGVQGHKLRVSGFDDGIIDAVNSDDGFDAPQIFKLRILEHVEGVTEGSEVAGVDMHI